jgi:hypothetical protein
VYELCVNYIQENVQLPMEWERRIVLLHSLTQPTTSAATTTRATTREVVDMNIVLLMFVGGSSYERVRVVRLTGSSMLRVSLTRSF